MLLSFWASTGSVGSLRSLLAKPGIGLALAIVAVLGIILGVIGILRVESFRKDQSDDNEQTRNAVIAGMQTILETMQNSRSEGFRLRALPSAAVHADPKPESASVAAVLSPQNPLTATDISALPAGIDATGEVMNPATEEPVLLVQSQHDGRGASLLLFTWQGFDLVPAAEATNATGATFSVAPDRQGLTISTLEADRDQLRIREYQFDGKELHPVSGHIASQDEIEDAFAKPSWAGS